MTASNFVSAADQLAEVARQITQAAVESGANRAAAAQALAAAVGEAAAVDPVIEAARADLREQVARHQADTAAYTAAVPQIAARLLGFVHQLAVLCDEVAAPVAEGRVLDAHGAALADQGRALGEPVAVLPSAVETVSQLLRASGPDGVLLQRLYLTSRRGRAATAAYLAELVGRLAPRE